MDFSHGATLQEEFSTPLIITVIVVTIVIEAAIITGMVLYKIDLEKAKTLKPNSIGYGKWYFSAIARFIILVGGSILAIVVAGIAAILVFVTPGPAQAQAHARAATKAQFAKAEAVELKAISS